MGVEPEPLPKVVLELTLTVADPQAFVDDPASTVAMTASVAEMAEVEESAVTVELSVGARRRLQEALRRLSGTVVVDAEIEAATEAAANAVSATLDEVSMDMWTNSTLTALEAAGVNTDDLGLEVTGVVKSVVIPTQAPTTGGSGTASGAVWGRKASGLALISALLLSLVSSRV